MWEPKGFTSNTKSLSSVARNWKQLETVKNNRQDVPSTTIPFKAKSRVRNRTNTALKKSKAQLSTARQVAALH